MLIHEQLPYADTAHVLRARDRSSTALCATITFERLLHLPLRARVEKCELVAFTQPDEIAAGVFAPGDADCDRHTSIRGAVRGCSILYQPALLGRVSVKDVELDARITGVVDEKKVAVQLDMLGARDLDGGIGLLGKFQWRRGETGEERSGRKVDRGPAERGVCSWYVDDFED